MLYFGANPRRVALWIPQGIKPTAMAAAPGQLVSLLCYGHLFRAVPPFGRVKKNALASANLSLRDQ